MTVYGSGDEERKLSWRVFGNHQCMVVCEATAAEEIALS